MVYANRRYQILSHSIDFLFYVKKRRVGASTNKARALWAFMQGTGEALVYLFD